MKSHHKLSKNCSIHGKNREISGPYDFWTPVKGNIPDVWNRNCWTLFDLETEVRGRGIIAPLPTQWMRPSMCETFHKQDKKKKQTLKYLVDCTLNSKFNVRLVTGKSAKCLNLLRNRMCRSYENNRFPPLSKFPPTDWWWLGLFSRRFCSSNNYYCFFWSFASQRWSGVPPT